MNSDFFWPYWRYTIVYLPFVFTFGAIVGSFLNVVILRVPAHENIVRPPSHCPVCSSGLRWYENLPIIGWIRLRGRCGHCGTRISPQYPLIELLCGIIFVLVFTLCYMIMPDAGVMGRLVPSYFRPMDMASSWPMLILFLILLSSLLAMTIIDYRTYSIPIEITWAVTIPAFIVFAVMPVWPAGHWNIPLKHVSSWVRATGVVLSQWTIPLVSGPILAACIGAFAGIGISTILIRTNVLRYGFLDFAFYVKGDDAIIDYPHARREIEWEIDFLIPVVLSMILGWRVGLAVSPPASLPLWAAALGGSMLGYLVGAGLVWIFRILGTLAFGKEAMGLGDAHLLGCVGAVLGWLDPIIIFFLAPFLAIGGMAVAQIVRKFTRNVERYIPYGPWLALATVFVMFGHRAVETFLTAILRAPVSLP